MEITSPTFKQNSAAALADRQLQKALGNVRGGFIDKRRKSIETLPEFDRLRDNARDIKDHALVNLDLYFKPMRPKVAAGGQVHWAETAEQAQHHARHLPRPAPTVTKGKSMITEEIDLNDFPSSATISAGRDRSRRYIIQPATSIRATSSRPPCIQQGTGRSRFPARPHAFLRRAT